MAGVQTPADGVRTGADSPLPRADSRLVPAVAGILAAVLATPVIGLRSPVALVGLAVVAIAFGAVLLYVGLCRFDWFLTGLLTGRASVDAVSGGPRQLEPSVLIGMSFIVFGALWYIAQRGESRRRTVEPLLIAMGLLVGAAALSIPTSVSPSTSVNETLRLTAAMLMAVVVSEFVGRRWDRLRMILVAAFASAVLPVGLALVQFVTGGARRIGELDRVTGTFGHPNSLAIYLVFLLAMAGALLPHLGQRGRQAIVAFAVVGGGVLVVTYARGALLALLAAAVAIALIQDRRILIGMLLVGALAFLLVPSVAERWTDVGADESVTGEPTDSLSWRFSYWKETLDIGERNRITGVGLGGVSIAADEAKPPHNDVVRAAVELGVVGLGAYVAFLVVLVGTARRALRRTAGTTGMPRGVAVGYCGCLVAFLTLSLTSNLINQVAVLWYFLAFAGAASAVARFPPEQLPRVSSPVPGSARVSA